VIIVRLTRLVAIDDVSQFDYFRHLASAASTTAVAPAFFGPDQNARYCQGGCGMPRPSNGAGGLSGSLRVVRATSDPEHLGQSADCRHTRQAEGEFGIDARNPTQVPNTIGDLRLIDHLVVEIRRRASLLARH
jgi:hypothetical protein